MLRAITIDDVRSVRENIIDLVNDFCSADVHIIAEADSVKSGVEQIKLHKPDLIFLDIEMPDGNGFDLLKEISLINCKVIFITAYDHYAVKAFKYNAIDYLLKPIDAVDLVEAIKKVKAITSMQKIETQFNTLFLNLQNIKQVPDKLILKTSDSIHSVDVKEIIRCESDNNYTKFHISSGKKILISTTLKEYEDLLAEHNFFRVHQSHLINMLFFDHFKKNDGGTVVMKDNSEIPVATRKREQLFRIIENNKKA